MRDDQGVDLKGNHLLDKQIDLVISGGIAAVQTVKLVRELRRYGARVRVVMTPAATQFITPLSLEWASRNPVITDLSGSAEHITSADAVIVAPCTLDFLSKIALGLCDSAASTLVQSAVSRLPVFIAPSMHSSLQQNPAYERHLKTLQGYQNVRFLFPLEEEGKAKLLESEWIVPRLCHELSMSSLKGRRGFMTLGPTRSYWDDVRFLTNYSTGALGVAIADELYRRGAEIILIAGPIQKTIPTYLNFKSVETSHQMSESAEKAMASDYSDFGIFSAAVLDFEIVNRKSGKISSAQSQALELQPSPKIIQKFQKEGFLKVGFKLEKDLSVEALKKRVIEWAEKNSCPLVVANRKEDISEKTHRTFIFSKESNTFLEVEGKAEIAKQLADQLELIISRTSD